MAPGIGFKTRFKSLVLCEPRIRLEAASTRKPQSYIF